jgi:acyl-CoA thioester hydrolase
MSQDFSFQCRVYFEDTDAGGIVYYANYLKFCERARTEWLLKSGLSQQSLLDTKHGFVIRTIAARYLKSARLEDFLKITVIPIKVGACGLKIFQQIYNQRSELLFEFECSLAYIDFNTARPIPMPKEAKGYIKSFIKEDGEALGVKI